MSRPEVTPEEFRAAVKSWVQSRNTARNELAAAFEVAMSTVDRWWIGTATPHPLLQVQVITWIRSHT